MDIVESIGCPPHSTQNTRRHRGVAGNELLCEDISVLVEHPAYGSLGNVNTQDNHIVVPVDSSAFPKYIAF